MTTALETALDLAQEIDDYDSEAWLKDSNIRFPGRDRAQIIWDGLETESQDETMHPQERTKYFHLFYDAPIRSERPDRRFSHMTDKRAAFRVGFILEEVRELLKDGFGIELDLRFSSFRTVYNVSAGSDSKAICEAVTKCMATRDLVEVVDALGDLNVVVNGFALELGVDMNAVDQEIAASNFTKMGADGNPIIGDGITGPVGKVLKGPNFVKPQIAKLLGFED